MGADQVGDRVRGLGGLEMPQIGAVQRDVGDVKHTGSHRPTQGGQSGGDDDRASLGEGVDRRAEVAAQQRIDLDQNQMLVSDGAQSGPQHRIGFGCRQCPGVEVDHRHAGLIRVTRV